MKTIGIICEYNPFHLGHKKQIDTIRHLYGTDCAVVCLMSGNFVQRGAPAIVDKSLRAKAAVLGGADLVLELPVQYALSSAEGFAAGGVRILSPFCDGLCFGTETGNRDTLMATAAALLSSEFSGTLRKQLDKGISFPAARQAALAEMGVEGTLLRSPNDILAVEYCKAILSQGSTMEPVPIRREGGYHDTAPDVQNPSATSLRGLMCSGAAWETYVPESARGVFRGAPLHTPEAGERAVLARLRTMTDEEFETLPYGSEGLWRKFMHACRNCAALEDIIAATKSKRYTRTRIDRMVMCAFLGISKAKLESLPPYTRVLAFRDAGKTTLKNARKTGAFLHTGEVADDPFWLLECRCDDLYSLFCEKAPGKAGGGSMRRVYIK